MTIRDREYPIAKGLPDFWVHTKDECYSRLRGTEWAATGKVTQKIPADFPTPDQPSARPFKVAGQQ